ncbi:M14 family metallopeptidase [Gloeobacter morelensis]|uniref:Succinylglutamate desuccinylase/aspartoacylase family protein n=1 Tax=Gloeobacter morelensis MG652769 TaxID=2781736 RepID=A0ABY3PS49_9CYAN|nr:M14 family metallopeptidase [Gloeobacter morelensis]UFP96292.1 succinylglutamate desuccinylase/aspartoacylase family protein [Gloeobacter morelensis MG652769]
MQKSLGPLLVPFGGPLNIAMQEFGRGRPVLSVVGGLHGDAYNGVYTCHLLIEWLRRQELRQGPYQLRGKVRVLPAVNPPGLLLASRHWPFDNTDLDRVFPGYAQGETTQRLASWVFEQVRHSDCCVELHGPENHLAEWPRVQVYHSQPRALDLAQILGLPVVWVRRRSTAKTAHCYELPVRTQGTLAHNLSQAGVDVLVIRAGGGQAIEPEYCTRVFAGLVRLMLHMGIVLGPPPEPPGTASPRVVTGTAVQPVHCRTPGLFVPAATLGESLAEGEVLAQVVDPLRGETLERVHTTEPGLLIALRTHPVVMQGALVACLVRNGH